MTERFNRKTAIRLLEYSLLTYKEITSHCSATIEQLEQLTEEEGIQRLAVNMVKLDHLITRLQGRLDSKRKAFIQERTIDHKKIEKLYTTTTLSLREIAGQCNCSNVAVMKHAKKLGLVRGSAQPKAIATTKEKKPYKPSETYRKRHEALTYLEKAIDGKISYEGKTEAVRAIEAQKRQEKKAIAKARASTLNKKHFAE